MPPNLAYLKIQLSFLIDINILINGAEGSHFLKKIILKCRFYNPYFFFLQVDVLMMLLIIKQIIKDSGVTVIPFSVIYPQSHI